MNKKELKKELVKVFDKYKDSRAVVTVIETDGLPNLKMADAMSEESFIEAINYTKKTYKKKFKEIKKKEKKKWKM